MRYATDAFLPVVPGVAALRYPLNLTRPGLAGRPGGRGVLTVAADADLTAAALALDYAGGPPPAAAGPRGAAGAGARGGTAELERHRVWGPGGTDNSDSVATGEPLGVAAPADQGQVCAGSVCVGASRVQANLTRSGYHSARIPRLALAAILAGAPPHTPGPGRADPLPPPPPPPSPSSSQAQTAALLPPPAQPHTRCHPRIAAHPPSPPRPDPPRPRARTGPGHIRPGRSGPLTCAGRQGRRSRRFGRAGRRGGWWRTCRGTWWCGWRSSRRGGTG